MGILVGIAVVAAVVTVVVLKTKKQQVVEVTEEKMTEERVIIETDDSLMRGQLQINNGLCATIGSDSHIYMQHCDGTEIPEFSLWPDARIRTGQHCLSVHENAYLNVEPCDAADNHQGWEYDTRGQLRNEWSGYCAMHVTNPDHPEHLQQVAMAQPCNQDQAMSFLTWRFYGTA